MEELLEDIIKEANKLFDKLQREIYTSVLEAITDLKVKGGSVNFSEDNIETVAGLGPNARVGLALSDTRKHIEKSVKKVIGFSTGQLDKYDTSGEGYKAQVIEELEDHVSKNVKTSLNTDSVYMDTRQKILAQLGRTEGISLTDLRRELQKDLVAKEIAPKYFAKWTQDIYYQYERSSKNKLRKKLGLRFAIYQGGLIDTSRPFCEARNGKVFHEDEIEKWAELDFSGKPDSYNPMIDLGGHRCRHRLDWISDELAYRLRPDLVKIYGPLKAA